MKEKRHKSMLLDIIGELRKENKNLSSLNLQLKKSCNTLMEENEKLHKEIVDLLDTNAAMKTMTQNFSSIIVTDVNSDAALEIKQGKQSDKEVNNNG